DPKHIVHWWGPKGFSTTIEAMDVRPGGAWTQVMRGPDGTLYPNKIIFTEIVKPERIAYSQSGGRKGGPGAHFEGTWTFESLEAGKTRATIRMVFPTAAERDRVVGEFGVIEGGLQTLERFEEYVVSGFRA
ncbi:MAG TPA: SRPBCC domain-containing protein, partial [Vicinamibacteria bacterium]|nr:SRPBCC domain-containing protein [Vicinamibacteria bacterium]